MVDPTLVAIIAASIPATVTAVGVFYGIFKNNQREARMLENNLLVATKVEQTRTEAFTAADKLADVAQANQASTEGKLHEIHVLVNDQLSRAVERAAAAESRNDVLTALLRGFAPDHPLLKEKV